MNRGRELDDEGCMLLLEELLVACCRDYKRNLKRYLKKQDDMDALGQILLIEKFLRGEVFLGLCDIDPEALIERLRKEVLKHVRV